MSVVAGSSLRRSLRDVDMYLKVLGIRVIPPTSKSFSKNLFFACLSCYFPMQLSNTNQIFGAASQMEFSLGTVVIKSITDDKLMNIARCMRPDASHVDIINGIAGRNKASFHNEMHIRELQPPYSVHVPSSVGPCHRHQRRNLLGWQPSIQTVQTTLTGLSNVDENRVPDSDWIIQMYRAVTAVNYMMDALKYLMQKDRYSCKFYVISTWPILCFCRRDKCVSTHFIRHAHHGTVS